MTHSPSSLVGGGRATVGVVLNVPTLTGKTITLTSSSPSVLPLPASVTVAPFASGASVTVATSAVGATTPVTITATNGSTVKTAVLSVTPAPALTSLVLSPASVLLYNPSTGTVTLNAPAPAGGATVALSSPTPSLLASLPASVVIPAGMQFATFGLQAGNVSSPTDVTVNAAYAGATVPATLHITPAVAPLSVTIAPALLLGGTSASGTVALNGAPVSTATISLASSQPSVLAVPASVSVFARQTTSLPFTVTTAAVTQPTNVTVTATYGGSTATATVRVTPDPAVRAVTAIASLVAGAIESASVVLDGPAGPNGEVVTLESSDPSVASVPASVTVPAGATSATFAITAGPVSQTGLARLTASGGGEMSTVDVTVTPTPVVTSLSLSWSSVAGGGTLVPAGTITLNGAAPSGGVTVSLSSDTPAAASVPATVTIPAGASQATFAVTTSPVASDTSVVIAASGSGSTAAVALTVRRPRVQSLAIAPAIVLGGEQSTATVTLDGPALAGGTRVNLAYLSPTDIDIGIPNEVAPYGWLLINEGQSQATFPIDTFPLETVICSNYVDLTASTGPDDATTARIIVLELSVAAIQVSPSRIVGGASATVTVTLNGTPPSGPVTVPLTSSNPATVSVPSSVVMAGISITFNVGTSAVSADTPVTLTATYGYGASYTPISRSVVLTVTPGTALSSLTLTPSTVVGGVSSAGKVTLNAGAPAGGAVVTLSSNSPKATVPASVTVPAGLDNATFTVSASAVSSTTPAAITGTYGVSQQAVLSITAAPAVSAVTVSPASVAGGTAASGTVTLNAAAPSGGVVVTLSSSNTSAATVPPSVTVAQGQVSASFTVTTLTVGADAGVTITATGGGSSATAPLTVRAPSPQLDGVAPGAALPGDATPVVYGSNFASNTTIQMSGPVYSLTNTTTALCTVGGNCPTLAPPSAVNGTLNSIGFSLPSGLATGYYWVQAKSATGALSGGAYVRVDAALKTRPVVAPTQHNNAPGILSGQTWVGTFAANNDPANTYGDYNDFYFVATAGTTINVTLDRADATKPWEHPDELDPQIEVIAPDGLVYANLKATDRQPGSDLNATLSNAVLPLTGVYYLRAETSKGFGDYRLTFSFGSVAAAPAAQRSIAFAGSVNTAPVNTSVWLQAAMLDPRGYPTSGAIVQFATANGPDDHATITFPLGTWAYTNTDGVAAGSVRPTAVGKAQLTASYSSTLLGSFMIQSNTERGEAPIPRYAPVASAPIRGVSVAEDGSLMTEQGKYEPLPTWAPSQPTQRVGKANGSQAGRAVGAGLVPAQASLVARPLPLSLTLSPESISSCSAGQFTIAGVNWAATNPPYTVTLTDEMPSTGQSQPNGLVDALGIHGHRIEKTIRMKIDIKDKDGATPPHAVLVNLALAGPSHGTLILDPDGNRIQCSTASFLWHERDAQGNIIALNEEFEYTLGTYAPYVGVVPDSQNPSVLKPVWGTAEVLGLVISTVDSTGANLRQPYSYKVKPEPGKPDHFSVSVPPPPSGTPEPIWTYWADNGKASGVVVNGRTGNGVDVTAANRYYLMDIRENVTFGYAGLQQPVAPGQTISLSVFDQTSGATSTGGAADPNGYGWRIMWNDNPAMPSGPYYSALTVNYPADPDWSAGSVSKPLNFQFDRGTFNFVIGVDGWDYLVNPPVAYDPRPPWTVSPGASGDALPKSVDQPDPLYPQGQLDAARFALVLARGTFTPASPYSVFTGGDPVVETTDNPAFRVSLVDSKGVVALDARFRVHLCPRVDHFPGTGQPRPCTTTAVESSAGVIDSIRVNAAGSGAADSQGYLGVELLTAPMNPGTYYIKLETLEGRQYRVRELADIGWDRTPAGEYAGGWALVTVVAADLLDEDFQRFDPALNMSVDRVVYVREMDPNETSDSYSIDVVIHNEDTQADTVLQNVTLRRLGRSATFTSDAISVVSPDPPPAGVVTPELESNQRASPLLTLGIHSVAGTLSPTAGRYTFKDRRDKQGTIVLTKLHIATTRLVEILAATPNFDGVTTGDPLGGANPARDRIEARIKWGTPGFVGVKLFNVDSDAIFTFDYWLGRPLTTDLRGMGGLPLGPADFGAKDQESVVPSRSQFKALMAPGTTVSPGLYRIRAHWAPNATSALSKDGDPFCVTDRPQTPVCDNEWIVSVGQRVFLDSDPEARNDLDLIYLPAVGDSRTSPQFLDAVATAATALFAQANGNVVVSTNVQLLRPFLTHRVKRSFPVPDQCAEGAEDIHYGCTNNDVRFPLVNPDLDLGSASDNGIDIASIYHGPARGFVSGVAAWTDHLPVQPRNVTPNLWSASNLSPKDVFFNRVVNVVAHEVGHGVGLVGGSQYWVHGTPTRPASLHAVVGAIFQSIQGLIWVETDVFTDLINHEAYRNSASASGAQVWLMQAAPFRWRFDDPQVPDVYDDPGPSNQVSNWLLLDHPLRFSVTSDFFLTPDRSIQQFFGERLPLCSAALRYCR